MKPFLPPLLLLAACCQAGPYTDLIVFGDSLSDVGNNMFIQSVNSGDPNIGPATTDGGRVMGGTLENSNVDTAEQFVRLIEAQRGFQANARVITTQDEVLAEVVNLL